MALFFQYYINKTLFWSKKGYLRNVEQARLIIGAIQPYSSKTGNIILPVMAPTLPMIICMLTAMALTSKKHACINYFSLQVNSNRFLSLNNKPQRRREN